MSKIDKFDKGIADKLRGVGPGSMQLDLGCIAVLNRTQEEIEQNIPFDIMRRREEEFFRSKQAFKDIPPEYLGCTQLIKRLAYIQQDRIRSTLPSIIEELKKQIKTKKLELKNLPKSVDSEGDCWAVYHGLLRKYHNLVNARVNGIYDNDLQMLMERPNGITNISDDHIAFEMHKQQKIFAEKIRKLFSNFLSANYRQLVVKLLEENAGVSLPNFPSFSIIERLYRTEHAKFRRPCEELIEYCVEYFKTVLIKLLHQAFADETAYKNNMLGRLTEIVLRTISNNEEECHNDVKKMLEIEKRVFTLNHYYMDTVNLIRNKHQAYQDQIKQNPSAQISSKFDHDGLTIDFNGFSNEYQAALDIQIAVRAYCHVVEKRLIDQICQVCYHWFITEGALTLDTKLSSAFTSAMLFEWMREPFEQQEKRRKLKESIEAMEKALSLGQNA